MSLTEKMDTDGIHVVFGATGAYGYSVIRKLLEKRWSVRAVVRDERKAADLYSGKVEVVLADVMNEEEVSRVCKDASVIYLGHNFPYVYWKKYYLRSILNILKGCEGSRPLIVFPGNVYGYGRFQHLPVDESHLLNAKSEKGMIRNQIEAILWDYHLKGKLNVIIPRFADFYGPNVVNELYGAIFRNAIKDKSVLWPMNADVEHNFTYIDDAADATLLMVQEPETYGKVFHVAGPSITARKFIEEIFHSAGGRARIKVLSRKFIRAMGFFNSNASELIELLYEYEDPYVLDSTKLLKTFPNFFYTPYEMGIRRTVDWFKNKLITQ
ncbi:MAG: NAD-dependent epimerase/dehydratase family protein [Thermoplasmataceae archaeon]|jgi:nucleoside-diphosphate-sugar epimerase